MREFLKMLIEDVVAGPNSGSVPKLLRLASFVDGSALDKATAGWAATLKMLQNGVVRPTSTIILSLLFVIELASITQKVDADSEVGMKLIGTTFLKFALCKVVFDNVGTILVTISSITTGWSARAAGAIGTTSVSTNFNVDQFLGALDSEDFLTKGIAAILIVLGWLFAKIPVFAMIAMLVTRFIKVQCFSVAAPLPMSFLPHQESRMIGIGFLKNYGAACLQLFVITLVVPLFGIMTSFVLSAVEVQNGFQFLTQLTGALILVGLICMGLIRLSTEVADKILGA